MVKVKKNKDFKKRKEIYEHIVKHPGLHFSELSRNLKIPKSTMNYHLHYLKKNGFIKIRCDKRYIRYYAPGLLDEFDEKIIRLIRQTVPSKIIFYLFLHPDSSQRDIGSYLDKHPSTISFHLKKLIDCDILACNPLKNKIQYSLKHMEHISRLIDKYEIVSFDKGYLD